MTTTVEFRSAVLDSEHAGDIRGALGTIRLDDTAPRRGRSAALKTLLAIIGPEPRPARILPAPGNRLPRAVYPAS